ncbi:universal stress protein UspF [Escherichia coli]
MKSKVLALLIPALLAAGAAHAAEVYNKDGNKLDLYGKVDGLHYFSDNSAKDGDQSYARLGFKGETQIMDDLKAEAKSQLEEIIKKFKLPTDRVHVHVEEGSPKDRILELAKKIPAHMIIIASHRPDITTYLLGSNAAAVVRHAECSVLVVR